MVTAATVARTLGGVGRSRASGSEFALVGAVRDGLPLAALDRLITDGAITEAEIEAHFIPRRTLYARRQKGTLSREQSDLIVRLARVQAMAEDDMRDLEGEYSIQVAHLLSAILSDNGGRID